MRKGKASREPKGRSTSVGRYSRPDYVSACTSTSSVRIATKQLQPTLNQSITTSNDPLLAAVTWVLKTMGWHYSYSSFSCGENKACICLNIWICALLPSARRQRGVTLGYKMIFDECLNKVLQPKQMDLHVQIWDGGKTLYVGLE